MSFESADKTPAQSGAEQRWAKRRPSRILATITGTVSPMNCLVKDTSSTGAQIELVMGPNSKGNAAEKLPKTFTLVMPADRSQVECEIAWAKGNTAGVRFTSPARTYEKPVSPLAMRKKVEEPRSLVGKFLGKAGFAR